MSKEFEEIVLKKLEKLDVLENKVENVILNKLNILDERTQNTDTVIEEVILKKLEKLDVLETEVKGINQRLDNHEKELKSTQETVKNLNDCFAVFDFESNKKVDTLFDAITANKEKHDLFEQSIVSLNTKTFNHDIRISVLEDYSKNAKLFATN